MRIFLLSGIFALLVYSTHTQANTLPGRPINVTLLADDHNIAVSWEPPSQYNGTIQKYIITWAILPNFTDVSSRNLVDGNLTISFIAIKDDIGRLFRVRVRAASESGIGEYSLPRYIRIGCGHNVTVDPEKHRIVTSPGFNATLPLKSGVVCKWQILTRSIYSLRLNFRYMNLFASNKKINCDQMQTYVNVSNVGLFCNANDIGRDIITRQSSLTISLITGLESGGRGFSLLLSAEVKSPGPPVNITTRVTSQAIIVAWEPPIEETLPVTSYIIRYRVLPQGHAYRIVVGALMRAFPVNTDKTEGKLFSFSVAATIRSLEGEASSKVYARASCQRAYYLQPGQSVNITSPNYPDAYPDSIVCIWTIQCSPETALRMTYYDFQLEDIPFCNSDYIIFSNKREPECARIKVPYFLETRLQQINVTFVTDNANQYIGFLINFAAKDFSGYRPGFPNTDITLLSTALTDFSPKTRKLLTHHKFIPSSAVVYSQTLSASASLSTQTSPASVSSSSVSKSSSVVTYSVPLHISSTANYSLAQTSSTLDSSPLYPNSSASVSKSEYPFPQTTLASQTAVSLTEPSSSSATLDPVKSLPIKTSHRKLSPNTEFISESSSSEVSVLSETDSFITSPVNPANSFTVRLSEQILSKTTSKFNLHRLTKDDHEAGTTISSKGEGVTEKSFREDDHEATAADILVPVLLSAAGCAIVACVVITVLCRRFRRRRKIKIEYQSGNRYRRNHIELHDILQESRNTLGKNAIFKTVSSLDMFGKLESRKRRSTFPFCYSLRKRKVHQAIQREMTVFGSFIEDKDALEERLRRRHEHRRSSSF